MFPHLERTPRPPAGRFPPARRAGATLELGGNLHHSTGTADELPRDAFGAGEVCQGPSFRLPTCTVNLVPRRNSGLRSVRGSHPDQRAAGCRGGLGSAQTLWQENGLPWEQLGGFLAEFQVAVDEDGLITRRRRTPHRRRTRPAPHGSRPSQYGWRPCPISALAPGADRRPKSGRRENLDPGGRGVLGNGRICPPCRPPSQNGHPPPFSRLRRRAGLRPPGSRAREGHDPRTTGHPGSRANAVRRRLPAEGQNFRLFAILLALVVVMLCGWLLYRIVQTPGLLKRLIGH